jgi:hypothetical protein
MSEVVSSTNRSERFLEGALFFALLIHFVATVSMGLVLLPAMPGAIFSDLERVRYIAEHPLLWHLGWLPWHLCALSDFVLAIAMLRTPWIPRIPAIATLVFTTLAVAVEQPAELRWNLEGVSVAQLCMKADDIAPYLDFENEVYVLVAAIAAVLYAFMAICWTWAFAAAGTWNRLLTWLSILTWSTLMFAAAGPLFPEPYRPPSLLLGFANAVGFNGMALWFVLVLEAVLRRSRQDEQWGRMATWRHPRSGFIGTALTAVGNSRFLRYVGETIPAVGMVSDIEDVIYINYLVDARLLEPLVPLGLELQRLGPDKSYGLFSVLTYRHGHFGPRILGRLRNFMPSPIQSNWRIHVRDRNGVEGIFFVATVVTSSIISLGGRLLADGVPMHISDGGAVTVNSDGTFDLKLIAGTGSAPDMVASLSACPKPVFQGEWLECFGDFDSFLSYCVPQDRAISGQPWYQQITKQEINLGIPLSSCQPLEGTVKSKTIEQLIGRGAQPICFRVPRVSFSLDKVDRYKLDNTNGMK